MTFAVPSDAPATLIYQCGNHPSMTNNITVGNAAGQTCSVNNDCQSGLYCTLGVCCQSSSCTGTTCNSATCAGGHVRDHQGHRHHV